MTAPERTWPRLLAALLRRQDLSADDTRWAMREVMDDAHRPGQLAGFLVALSAKGETAEEISGMLGALMEGVARLPVDGAAVTDIVGTGGDGAHTVNISTMAAIITAAAGTPVVKHGGRSASSKCGAADVLEELGIPLDLSPEQVARCVTETGIGFSFAPAYVRGLRHAAPVRRDLGIPTAINYLAPLTNPARPGTVLAGCASLRLAPVLAEVLAGRGTAALVVRGRDGLDEITTTTVTDVWVAAADGVSHAILDTARFGLGTARPADLAGGDAAYNAAVVRDVVAGRPGPVLDAVLANAAGALAARTAGDRAGAGLEDAFAAGLARARAAVESGSAAVLLDRWAELAATLATT